MMKRNMCLAVIAVLSFWSLAYAQKTVVLGNLNFKSETTYSEMVISEVIGGTILPIDTVAIDKKGDYKAELTVKKPSLYVVQFLPSQNEATHWFLVPKERVRLNYDIDKFPILTSVKGSDNMVVYKGFFEKNIDIEILNREYPLATTDRKKEIEQEFRKVYPQLVVGRKSEMRGSLHRGADCAIGKASLNNTGELEERRHCNLQIKLRNPYRSAAQGQECSRNLYTHEQRHQTGL